MGNCCKSTETLPKSNELIEIPESLGNKIDIRSFVLITVLGKGAFGRVSLMEKKDNRKKYAVKCIEKQLLVNRRKKKQALCEREVLAQLNSPFIVKLRYAFQNPKKLFLVVDFMQGGNLYTHLRLHKTFSEQMARFYAVEIILGLQDLHENNILYRDLKLENVLVDNDGHIKLADFNLSKIILDNETSNSLCGTPEYIAPEILSGSAYDKGVDFWGLGCILYEMIEGKSPFYCSNYSQLFTKIVNLDYTFTENFSKKAKNLISKLLTISTKLRLVSFKELKNHDFFEGIDWEAAYSKKYLPPIRPELDGEVDFRYFNTNYSNAASPKTNFAVHPKDINAFKGFTYEESPLFNVSNT